MTKIGKQALAEIVKPGWYRILDKLPTIGEDLEGLFINGRNVEDVEIMDTKFTGHGFEGEHGKCYVRYWRYKSF